MACSLGLKNLLIRVTEHESSAVMGRDWIRALGAENSIEKAFLHQGNVNPIQCQMSLRKMLEKHEEMFKE